MSRSSLASLAAAAFIVIGLAFGLTEPSVGGSSCQALLDVGTAPIEADGCDDARAARKPIVWSAFGLAAVAFIAWRSFKDDEEGTDYGRRQQAPRQEPSTRMEKRWADRRRKIEGEP